MRIVALLIITFICPTAFAQTNPSPESLRKALLLHAPFDGSANATYAKGDKKLFSTQSTKLTDPQPGLKGDVKLVAEDGRFGGCLHYTKKSKWFPFFKGEGNFPMPKEGKSYAGTFSFWMKLDPAKDLAPGFVDPIQITDKKWNDASFFLDFTKENPRQFRLGAYSNYKHWNPKGLKYDDIPDNKRPLGAIKKLPFSQDKWTHVAFTWDKFNTQQKAPAVLWINGKAASKVNWEQQYNWDPKKVGIMLGISYVGHLDDVSVFNRALNEREVQMLFRLPQGVATLHK